MRRLLVQGGPLLALAALFIAATHAQGGGVEVEVVAGGALELQCALPVGAAPLWTKDGAPPPADMQRAERLQRGRLLATLSARAAARRHQGSYSCGPTHTHTRVTVLDASTAATEGGAGAAREGPAGRGDVVWFEVRVSNNLSLTCVDAPPGDSVVWKANGTLLTDVAALKGRVELADGGRVLRVVDRAREDDWGNWTCAWGAGERTWAVHARPRASLPANSDVVEGQRTKLVCKLTGRPYAPVEWRYRNDSMADNETVPVDQVLGDRVLLKQSEQGVTNGELVLEPAARADAGYYSCRAVEPDDAGAATTTLRVKDMYAALWPFLGIVAEVVVLCAVILVYERRRQPANEDSDTDNHDQKKS